MSTEPLEDLVIGALADDDEPLFTVYRHVSGIAQRPIPFTEFLDAVSGMMARDEVRLWHADPTGDWTELFEVPPSLASDYAASQNPDAGYDAFHMMLTLGPRVTRPAKPWTIKFDPEDGTFVLSVEPGHEESAISALKKRDPSLQLDIRRRHREQERDVIGGTYRRD